MRRVACRNTTAVLREGRDPESPRDSRARYRRRRYCRRVSTTPDTIDIIAIFAFAIIITVRLTKVHE